VLANCQRVGEIAAEMLVGLVQRNVRGLPSVPTTTLVDPIWADGNSLPTPTASASWQSPVSMGYADEALVVAP
jgi:hypothetical protein